MSGYAITLTLPDAIAISLGVDTLTTNEVNGFVLRNGKLKSDSCFAGRKRRHNYVGRERYTIRITF
jgi:hypothetical protein